MSISTTNEAEAHLSNNLDLLNTKNCTQHTLKIYSQTNQFLSQWNSWNCSIVFFATAKSWYASYSRREGLQNKVHVREGGFKIGKCSCEQLGGGVEMLTDAHMGKGGVKICSNHAHVVYGRSLSMLNAFLKISIFLHNWASDWFHLLLTVSKPATSILIHILR